MPKLQHSEPLPAQPEPLSAQGLTYPTVRGVWAAMLSMPLCKLSRRDPRPRRHSKRQAEHYYVRLVQFGASKADSVRA